MTIGECYAMMGGDYEDVKTRLPSDALIQRFALRFLDDKSFEDLCREMEAGNRAEAFRAAHTLKGVCGNLGFSRLLKSASELTKLLRPEQEAIPQGASGLLEQVKADYEATAGAILSFKEQAQ